MKNLKNKKAQIWSIDLVFALVVFGFTLTILGATWLKVSNDISVSRGSAAAVLSLQSQAFADSLMSAGYPQNWYATVNTVNASTWTGLIPGIGSSSSPGVIVPYKLYALMALSNNNYKATSALFGSGYNYYIEIVGGNNAGLYNITIGLNPATNGATNVYVVQRSSTLYGTPVQVNVVLWSNVTSAVS